MDYAEIRKSSLKVFMGFLGLTALIAIISVLSGEFGSLQVKILATCFAVSAASICSMSCAAFIEKRKQAELGLSGIGLSILAAALIIIGLWPEIDSDEYWKTTATLSILAIAMAHAFLLALPELGARQKWVQIASSISIGALALLIILAVWAELDDDAYFKVIAVVSIIVGLETLVVPILMKMQRGGGPASKSLVLESLGGDRYRDAAGTIYNVREIGPESASSENAGNSPAGHRRQ